MVTHQYPFPGLEIHEFVTLKGGQADVEIDLEKSSPCLPFMMRMQLSCVYCLVNS